MLKTHLLITARGLRRRGAHALLHVGGLALGLACCFLVVLYVADELSFDRFHTNADHIFRLGEERMFNGEPVRLVSADAETVEALTTDVPVVEAIVQVEGGTGLVRRPNADEAIEEDGVLFATEAFFEVFSFPLQQGDPASVLDAPSQVVLAESAAARYFGEEDPVGQTLLLERQGIGVQDPEPLELTVSGVAADAPGNSSLQYDLIVSGATEVQGFGGTTTAFAHGGSTYVLTRRSADRAALAAATTTILEQRDVGFGSFERVLVDALPELHFAYSSSEGFAGKTRYLYLFGAVALVVLLIACINYTNLATAYAAQRAREVGVRKTLGAARGQLAREFLTETLMLALLAGVLAAALTGMGLPAFNHLFGMAVAFDLPRDGWLAGAMLGLVLLIGVGAGLYPALYLSRYRPADVLKGQVVQGRSGARLRRGLVVVQFAATVALLTAMAIIQAQLRYVQTRDLGFDGDQVLTLDLSAPALRGQHEAIRQAVEAVPGVRGTAFSSAVPGGFNMVISVSPAGTPDDPADDRHAYFADATPALRSLYGLELAAGRFFEEGITETGVVLNETAARELGLMADDPATAVGQKIDFGGEQEVLGVVRDFHLGSLRRDMAPVIFQPMGERANSLVLSVKLGSTDVPGTLDGIRDAWRRVVPHHPFAHRFVEDTFDALYRADRQLGQIFGAVAGIGLLLACLGLFGLAAYTTERRTKEIGVRKVLGASLPGLVRLLIAEFAWLVAAAFAIGAPVAYVFMQHWLDDFSYRTDLSAWPFIGVGVGVLVIALLTVSYHALRTALADPVKSLRYE